MRQWYNIIDIIPLRIWFLRLSQRSRRFIPPEGIISSIKTGRKCDMKKKNLIKGGSSRAPHAPFDGGYGLLCQLCI